MAIEGVRPGVYNVEYFSGAQVSLYIGDVWVDEVTTLSYSIMQNRTPIYGYASTLYDAVSEGHVLVQGTFTINFKESGYLWLILNRYKQHFKGGGSLTDAGGDPFFTSGSASRNTVERIINNETSTFRRNKDLQDLAKEIARQQKKGKMNQSTLDKFASVNQSRALESAASLGVFASNARASGGIGLAEDIYESFEDVVWSKKSKLHEQDGLEARRTDDPRLNPFDIYVAFGDFAGDNRVNHTIEKIETVTLLGKSKQIVIDGMPIQEQYQFIAKNLI